MTRSRVPQYERAGAEELGVPDLVELLAQDAGGRRVALGYPERLCEALELFVGTCCSLVRLLEGACRFVVRAGLDFQLAP